MTLTDLAGHLGFALIACSFLVRDLLWLRVIAIMGSLAAILYNYFAPAEPLWLVIGWNAAFTLVNIVQIVLAMHEQANVRFRHEEKDLYDTLFQNFSPVEFLKIMRLATWENREIGDELAREGESVESLMLIYNGEVEIQVKGKKVSTLRDGRFVAELSFISGNHATASAVVSKRSRMVLWKRDQLKALLNRNPTLKFGFQAVLTTDLYKKLQREGATTHTNIAFPS